MKERAIFTQAVHAGERGPRPDYSPVTTPIYTSVGYLYDEMQDVDAVFGGTKVGYVYSRYGSPTVSVFEQAIAALEHADGAVAYSTGMAAIHAALLGAGAVAGTTVVSAADVYGATHALQSQLLSSLGVRVRFLDISFVEQVEEIVAREHPVAILCEAISNPLLKIADIPALVEIAHRHGSLLIVDSTFATPYLLRPLDLGADYVVHSATKYIGGHGDVMAGVVASTAPRVADLRERQKLLGANLGPHEAWLALRGIKTLPLRVREQFATAQTLANWLSDQSPVSQVMYPGLTSHPQHELATGLFGGRGYGGMISFELSGAERAEVFRFMEALTLILPATTLGDVQSLILYPAHSSHRALPIELRRQLGISDGLVRLSVGIEDAADLMADLEDAMRTIGCP